MRGQEINIVRGEGCYLFDESGNRVSRPGGGDRGVRARARPPAHHAGHRRSSRDARALCSNLYHHEPAGTLADRLAELSGFDAVFFCNSRRGSERRPRSSSRASYAWRKGENERNDDPRRERLVPRPHARRTRRDRQPDVQRRLRAAAGAASRSRRSTISPRSTAAIDERTAAFIVEPVQGESGVDAGDAEFLQAARDFCNERGALLIFDESPVAAWGGSAGCSRTSSTT